jgi:dienelactone hydrolase
MRRSRHIAIAVVAIASIALTATVTAQAGAHTPPGTNPIVIDDATIPVPGQPPVHAWIVHPAHLANHADAGILFLHWLGQINSDRDEFLSEAVTLAKRGVTSVLPDGTFPYTTDPAGTNADASAVRQQLTAFHAALAALFAQPDVNPTRVALVGHDYGAMYGALLIDADHRIHAAVLATPDATWADWFIKYWYPEAPADYADQFAALDPIRHVGRLGAHLFLQFADQDIYVDAPTRADFAVAAPHSTVTVYSADHQLTDTARADRDAFLATQLNLPS